MRVTGRMIRCMDKVLNTSKMEPYTRGSTRSESRVALVHSLGQMVRDTVVRFKKTVCLERAILSGPMGNHTKVNGKLISCMAKAYSPTQMVRCTKDSSRMIRSMAKAISNGKSISFISK